MSTGTVFHSQIVLGKSLTVCAGIALNLHVSFNVRLIDYCAGDVARWSG